jgi:hypothetical protein
VDDRTLVQPDAVTDSGKRELGRDVIRQRAHDLHPPRPSARAKDRFEIESLV